MHLKLALLRKLNKLAMLASVIKHFNRVRQIFEVGDFHKFILCCLAVYSLFKHAITAAITFQLLIILFIIFTFQKLSNFK